MGIAAALCTIGGAAWGIYLYLTAGPRLELRRATNITFAYRPEGRTLRLTFGLGLHNSGRNNEIIGHRQATLSIAGDPSRQIMFSDPDIEFSQEGKPLPHDVVIEKESNRDVTCQIAKHLPEKEVALFEQHETGREFTITVAGKKQSYSMKICFDVGADVSQLLLSKNKTEDSLQLVPIDCL